MHYQRPQNCGAVMFGVSHSPMRCRSPSTRTAPAAAYCSPARLVPLGRQGGTQMNGAEPRAQASSASYPSQASAPSAIPGGRVSRIPLAAPPEGERRPRLLHDIFAAQALARPEAIAVEFGAQRTTYAELERRANRVARHLRARGVTRGSRLTLMLPRS